MRRGRTPVSSFRRTSSTGVPPVPRSTAATFPAWSSGNRWAPSALAVISPDGRCGSLQLPAGSLCFFLYHGVEQRAADCLELHRCGRLGPAYGGSSISGSSTGTRTVRGPVGCGDAGGYSNIDPAPSIDTTGRPTSLRTGHNASGRPPPSRSSSSPRDWSPSARAPDRGSMTEPRLGSSEAPEDLEGPWMRSQAPLLPLLLRRRLAGRLHAWATAWHVAAGAVRHGRRARSSGEPQRVIGPGGGSVERPRRGPIR